MSDTIRQQIVDAIIGALETISTDNGFQTDVGQNVHEWFSTSFIPDEDLPALILRDLDEPINEGTVDSSRHLSSLHIQIEIIAAGNTSPRIYRAILGDVNRAIRSTYDPSTQEWLGGLAGRVRPRLSRMVVEQTVTSSRADSESISLITRTTRLTITRRNKF